MSLTDLQFQTPFISLVCIIPTLGVNGGFGRRVRLLSPAELLRKDPPADCLARQSSKTYYNRLGAKRKKRGSISGKSKKISSRALRWKFYKDTLNYDFALVQVPLVGASIALYNFIRRYKIAGNAHTEHVRCSSVPDDMPTAKGGENMDNDLMVWDTDVDMARVHVRIRDHLFHIRNQRLL
ncbi:unnamed protein product [Camellia sinensis]